MAKLGEYGYCLETMTAQEVFNIGCDHLLTQNKKSEDSEGICMYDGDGVCCAAAPFIKEYHEDMEKESWETLVNHFDQPSIHKDLIQKLQFVHDNNEIDVWHLRLESVMLEFKLEPTKLLQQELDPKRDKYV